MGCLGSSSARDEHWIALTNKRVIYKTKTLEKRRYVEKNGILPLEKISFIEIADNLYPSGCDSEHSYNLLISTSGGTVNIPIPTKDKGFEIRPAHSMIADNIKNI